MTANAVQGIQGQQFR